MSREWLYYALVIFVTLEWETNTCATVSAFNLYHPDSTQYRWRNPLLTNSHDVFEKTLLRSGKSRRSKILGSISESTNSLTYKERLLKILEQTPRNAPTPGSLTSEILEVVKLMESLDGNVPESEVLQKLSGNWELLWTAQDINSREYKQDPFRRILNPLENQAYSNNPSGRSNPILPRGIQDSLEQWGILEPLENLGVVDSTTNREDGSTPSPSIKSSQSIDLKRQRVRNVVSFQLPSSPLSSIMTFNKNKRNDIRGSLTVDISFTPSRLDSRRVDVKFQACRIIIPPLKLDWNFPLGVIGPTGWLSTTYIDDNLRITRGHKGSVFVLTRPSSTLLN